MKFVTPSVFHIARTATVYAGIDAYLDHIGAGQWSTDSQSQAELLIEIAGRRCYKSFGVELNPNLSRVREGNYDYIGNILKSKHGSVIEHAYDSFAFEDVSRIATHEMVRHRICNFSQESMRFVRPTQLSTIFPQVYTDHLSAEKAAEVRELFQDTVEHLEGVQQRLIDICGMDDPNLSFKIKKLFQSANRRLIHDGQTTGIITTANHRTWRFIIQQRTSLGAEEEVRYIYNIVAQTLLKNYPALYQDMYWYKEGDSVNQDGEDTAGAKVYGVYVPEYKFKNEKI